VNGRAIEERTSAQDRCTTALIRVRLAARILVRRSDEQRRRYHPSVIRGAVACSGDKYFVLGDIGQFGDSRYWGFVDASAVKGRPLVVYFSYDRGTRDALPWLTDIRWSRLGSLIH